MVWFVFVEMADGCSESISKVQSKIRLGSKDLGFNCLISSLSDAACCFLATVYGDHHTAQEVVRASCDALVLTVAMEDESHKQIWLVVESRLKAMHSTPLRIISKIRSSRGFDLYTTFEQSNRQLLKRLFLIQTKCNNLVNIKCLVLFKTMSFFFRRLYMSTHKTYTYIYRNDQHQRT